MYPNFTDKYAQRIVGTLTGFSVISLLVFFRRGKPRLINAEKQEFLHQCGRYCSRNMFKDAFSDHSYNESGNMDGWYEIHAILQYNEGQCSHPETGQNDFDAYWEVWHEEFRFVAKTKKQMNMRESSDYCYVPSGDLPF